MNHAVKHLIIDFIPLGIVTLLWRVTQYLSPSIYMAVIGIFLFVALIDFYINQSILKQTLKWAWLIVVGAGLNFAAIIGNGGQMPYPHIMSSAWWVWLGDWLPMGFSPGDILMIAGFAMVTATLVIMQRRQQLVEA